jgi:hypothetical protein
MKVRYLFLILGALHIITTGLIGVLMGESSISAYWDGPAYSTILTCVWLLLIPAYLYFGLVSHLSARQLTWAKVILIIAMAIGLYDTFGFLQYYSFSELLSNYLGFGLDCLELLLIAVLIKKIFSPNPSS